MKKWMSKKIQTMSPLYFHILKEIKNFKRIGYEVKEIHLTSKELDELFTANTILSDGGLDPIVTFDEMHDTFFDGILIVRNRDRFGFMIKKNQVI